VSEPVELSIVMPCLNEAETLARCIEMARAFIQRKGAELQRGH
jgi:glycosyltransferase involved in cell wall biosynthesis